MGKDKLRKFRENETFACLVQPSTMDVFGKDHPLKGHWASDFFHNGNPIVLELGCGKGEYTIALAERNPAINYIGVDIKGARLWKGAKYATEHSMPNVGFLRTRIEFITSLFAPGEIAELWITFADPQIGREKKRLTSPLFLDRYRTFMKEGGRVHLKTDSLYLHTYSRAIAQQNGMTIVACTEDLYGDKAREDARKADAAVDRLTDDSCTSSPSDADSAAVAAGGQSLPAELYEVQTFYESHFIAQGLNITYLSFIIDHDGPYLTPEWDEDSLKGENHQAFTRGA